MASVDNLKVFAIAGHTDSAGVAVADVDQEELRLPVSALVGPGLLPNLLDKTANPNAYRVRQDTGSNMQVKVGNAVTAKIDGLVLQGTVAGQGSYVMRIEATTVTITVPAADATNPSRYGCYAWVNDTAYSGTASRAYQGISCIRGTPAGSPTTPGPLAVWSAWVLLWEFQLAANATAVTNTILDSGTAFDRRVLAASPIPAASFRSFATTTLRDAAITAPVEANAAVVTADDRLYIYDGSAWQRAVGYSATGRTSSRAARNATQTVGTGTLSTITWDTLTSQTDAFLGTPPVNIMTVPTGLGGWYQAILKVLWPSGAIASVAVHYVTINGADTALGSVNDPTATTQGRWASIGLFLAAADTIGWRVYQASGGSANISATFDLIRLAI